MRPKWLCYALLAIPCISLSQTVPDPIIDMHEHAVPADNNGPPPVFQCAPATVYPPWDPKTGPIAYAIQILKTPSCLHPLRSALTEDELMNRTLQILRQRNITAVTSGPTDLITTWKAAGGNRILPATGFKGYGSKGGATLDELRQLLKDKKIVALAEMTEQYAGMSVTDPAMEPYFALAEEFDVPVGIHMGLGPPGLAYYGAKAYRARLSSLLQLEDVLVKHPKLRVWAMHAGWPLIDDAVAPSTLIPSFT